MVVNGAQPAAGLNGIAITWDGDLALFVTYAGWREAKVVEAPPAAPPASTGQPFLMLMGVGA